MARPRGRPARPTKAGERLKTLREFAGLSQHALAAKSGVSRATIAALELGRYQGALARTLDKLASALGVPLTQLNDNLTTIDVALHKFESSPWFTAVAVSEPERDWLARTGAQVWDGVATSNQAFAELLAWRRRHRISG